MYIEKVRVKTLLARLNSTLQIDTERYIASQYIEEKAYAGHAIWGRWKMSSISVWDAQLWSSSVRTYASNSGFSFGIPSAYLEPPSC